MNRSHERRRDWIFGEFRCVVIAERDVVNALEEG
jgi:hypothetical protein